ncbi:MAG: type transport system permease protein [Actinomycetota bacterium]|jgi:ABC-type multidrug transport system permease subunit|nr:type transport system permease protein [Actinomycetota bacterium]
MSVAEAPRLRATSFGKLQVLLAMQLARLRTAWRPYLIVSSAMPLGIALLMRAVMQPSQVARYGTQIVAGSAVLAIAMTAIVMLAQRMASLKESGTMDFYTTLPVARAAVVGAVLLSFAVFALPGTLIVVTLGALLFHLSLGALWTVVPVWALGSFALAGLGLLIGFAAPDEQLAGMYSNLAMMTVLFLGILPATSIPAWLGPLKAVIPSTYAVNALKPGLHGHFSSGQLWDLLVLAGFGALSFWAVRGPLWPRSD